MVTPLIFYKFDVLHNGNVTLGFSSERNKEKRKPEQREASVLKHLALAPIKLSRHHNSRVNCFFAFLTRFRVRGVLESKIDRGSKEKSHLECHLHLRNPGINSHASGD